MQDAVPLDEVKQAKKDESQITLVELEPVEDNTADDATRVKRQFG